jgi:CCR4-NOT transcriptional regulation complex NOT5 subunit
MSEWVSVKERLPEAEGSYLVYSEKSNDPFKISVSYYSQESWRFFDYITHWMKLPTTPKDK